MQNDSYSFQSLYFVMYHKTQRFHLQELEDEWIIKENDKQKHHDEELISLSFWNKVFIFNMT